MLAIQQLEELEPLPHEGPPVQEAEPEDAKAAVELYQVGSLPPVEVYSTKIVSAPAELRFALKLVVNGITYHVLAVKADPESAPEYT